MIRLKSLSSSRMMTLLVEMLNTIRQKVRYLKAILLKRLEEEKRGEGEGGASN